MLKKVILASVIVILAMACTSCGVKKDCMGVKHYKDKKSGIYI
jgi:hypothetical protein